MRDRDAQLRWCVVVLALVLAACGDTGGGSNDGDGGDGGDPPGGAPIESFTEDFMDAANQDPAASDADWGTSEVSILQGAATTSRKVYVFGYQDAYDGVTSGRGQYFASASPLIGSDHPPATPASNLGRRVQVCLTDEQIGAEGTITNVAWGPDRNTTYAAFYPNIKIRMGFKAPGTGLALGPSFSGNFDGSPTLVYDGSYSVTANANVGNTSGHPTFPHVGGYAQNPGCQGTAGGWNKPLYDYTGFYDYPALTTVFDWDPGDFGVANDRILVFDVSAQEGSAYQQMRSWFATTFPCSGIFVAGYPKKRLDSVYESDSANPPDNFLAGIANPSPATMDLCLTITRMVSVAQSTWIDGAFGDDTDYLSPVIVPSQQAGAARIIVEFQGADALSPTGDINQTQPFTTWVQDIDACDGMRHIRFRIQLIPDPTTGAAARVDRLTIRMQDSDP